MESSGKKCVMVLDGELPVGLLANTAAILGTTLGKAVPEIVGSDVTDGMGKTHRGIVEIPVPILRGDGEVLRALKEKVSGDGDLVWVDFSDVAQSCKVYDEYRERLARSEDEEIHYFGIGLYGEKKKVNKLTGSLPLLR